MIHELNFEEIDSVNGAGVVESIVDGAQAVVEAAYDAGHKLGVAIGSLF